MVSEETAERIIDAYTISFFIGLSPLTSKKYVFKDYAKCNLFVFLFEKVDCAFDFLPSICELSAKINR